MSKVNRHEKMQTILSDLSTLIRSEYVQNADLIFGKNLIKLYNCILNGESFGTDFDSILLQLCVSNNRKFSAVNAEIIGKIASITLTSKNLHKKTEFVELLSKEIEKGSLQALIIFGNVIKTNGKDVVVESVPIIQKLLKTTNKTISPFIFQCFRRVIKGTGTLLKDSCSELFTTVLKEINSNDLSVQIECVKTLPCLLSRAHLNIKKLIMILEPYMSTDSKHLRYHIAKSMSKMMFYSGTQKNTDANGVESVDTKKMYKVAFNTILQYIQNYKNIPTLCYTMMMWVRNIKPTELTRRVFLFTKFALSASTFNIPITYVCTFSRTVLRSIISVIGTTYEPLICHYIYKQTKKDGFTRVTTMIALDTFINFRASIKTLTKAAKAFYPLLSNKDVILVRLVSSFFIVVGRREPRVSQILTDSFVKWLQNKDVKPCEIYGYSRGASIFVMTSNIKEETIKKITDICKEWLAETIENTDPRFAAALLLCSAVFKRSPSTFPMQLILIAFRALPRLFRAGEKLTEENSYLALPMKFGSILIKQVILSNSETLPSLYPTIQQCSITIAHNSGFLAAPTLLALWSSIRKCKPSWHISLPQTMMNATPTILARFYNPSENEDDYGMRKSIDEVDQAELLYGTHLPTQYATICTEKMETIYTLLVADVRTPMRDELVRVALRDYCSWAVLSANPLKKSVLGQLYTPYQEKDQRLFFLRLTLIRSITTKSHIMQFIRSDCLHVLFSFDISDIRTTRVLGAAIASYVNLNDDIIEELLEYIESPKVNSLLVAAVISELKFHETKKKEAIRCMLALERMILTDPNPLEFFALIHLIEENVITEEFVEQTINIIEKVIFSNEMISVENMYYVSQCIRLIAKKYPISDTLSSMFAILPFNKTLGLLLSLETASHTTVFMTKYKYSIKKPLPILTSYIKFLDTMQEVPLIIDIIQQHNSDIAENKMKELFYQNRDINFWVLLAKQIIIKGGVPFVGCETKISPSSSVVHATMLIVDLIAQDIHKTFPENSEKLNEIVSFPIKVLASKDINIHKCAFDMLTTFVVMFADINDKNGENALKPFNENLQIAFKAVFDKSHDFASGITFALTYYEYLSTCKDQFLEEATTMIISSINEIHNIDPINFIRLAGKAMLILGYPIKDIVYSYVSTVENFVSDVCSQKSSVKELRNEAYSTITTFFKLKKELCLEESFATNLIKEMKSSPFNESMMRLLTFLLLKGFPKEKEMLDSALSVVASSEYYKYEMEDYEKLPNPRKQNSISSFLSMAAAKIPPNAVKWESTFDKILQLTLSPRPTYTALALLIRCASYQYILQYGQEIITYIMKFDTKESEGIAELLFARTQVSAIDKTITNVIQCQAKPEMKFMIIKCALKHTNNASLNSLNNVAQLTTQFMYPNGAMFLGYILGNEKTVEYGLNILKFGAADYIMTHEIPEEYISVSIDLLIIATERMKILQQNEFWSKQTAKIAIKLLLRLSQTDRENISHIFVLFRTIDHSTLSSFLKENSLDIQKIFNHLFPSTTKLIE